LRATLDSALAQTHPRAEIILVDDGSRDDSLAIARTYADRGVRVVTQPNRGAAAARNHALRLSTGDWIQFLDADDLLAPEKIARQLARAAAAPASAIFTARWARFTDDPAAAHTHLANPLFADLTPHDYLTRYATDDCMMHPAAWLLPRAVAIAAGPWDERLSLNDDGEYFTRVVAASTAVIHCADALSLYRSALPASLSGQRSRRHLESAHLAATLTAEHFLLLDSSPVMRAAAADLLQRFAYDYYPAAPDLVADAEHRARALGGAHFTPLGGRVFQLARRIVGWKCARRLQVRAGRFAAPAR
jgi:hypothetical protein